MNQTATMICNSFHDLLFKISKGNPGALTALMEISQKTTFECVSLLEQFIKLKIYGSELYMLWNDSCDRDTDKLIFLLKEYRAGNICDHYIRNLVMARGRGIKFDLKEAKAVNGRPEELVCLLQRKYENCKPGNTIKFVVDHQKGNIVITMMKQGTSQCTSTELDRKAILMDMNRYVEIALNQLDHELRDFKRNRGE
ncbi:hypothetical protein KHQ81_12915 [Mycoplasmatota bacterium]|nr:hypothetical protein KHQ81_12915 [Mycoplasmatota bacterium]